VGAPQTQEVADRWHLIQNATTVLQEIVARHATALRTVAQDLTAQQSPAPVAELAPLPIPVVAAGHIVGPVALRQYQFAEAKRLHAAGRSIRQIARDLQLHRRTATRYVAAPELPRRVLPQSTSQVTPYLDYVRERWAAGAQNGRQLHAELQAQGYRGSLSSVYRALKWWRTGDGRQRRREPAAVRVAVQSPRQATWLLLRAPADLSAEEAAYRAALCAHSPTLATAAALAQRFVDLVRHRQAAALDAWLDDVEACGIKELVNLARSLRRDDAAVRAALTLPWSNGPTEGFVNKTKMIKRTMFGRAGVDLLRCRVLNAA
jgi:transposase